MEENVNDFLEKFPASKTLGEAFSGKGSYWFAIILHRRFIRDGATIMYNHNLKQYAVRIDKRVYDITGDVTTKCVWTPMIK